MIEELDALQFGVVQNVIEAADSVPTVTVRLERDAMKTVALRRALIISQEVDQCLAGVRARTDANLLRFVGKIVHRYQRTPTPVVAHRQDTR